MREEPPAQATTAAAPQAAAGGAASPTASTLIEFPGTARAAARPQWRKDLSERVREIQERRAREAARQAETTAQRLAEEAAIAASSPQLGLVPSPDAPPVNPIVAAALKRIERARQPSPPMSHARSGMSGGTATAAAVARVIEEPYQEAAPSAKQPPAESAPKLASSAAVAVPLPHPEGAPPAKTPDVVREHALVIVPPPPPAMKPEPATLQPPARRVSAQVLDDEVIQRRDAQEGADAASDEGLYDDRAPVTSRLVANLIDLFIVVFASSPFAAIIELTTGNWADWRLGAAMAGIVCVVMFLYLTATTALSGRTWGMSLLSVRVVDADVGLPPTTKQSVKRAITYMLSLATLGLGILYALVDAEGRAAHDYLSGTAVVRE